MIIKAFKSHYCTSLQQKIISKNQAMKTWSSLLTVSRSLILFIAALPDSNISFVCHLLKKKRSNIPYLSVWKCYSSFCWNKTIVLMHTTTKYKHSFLFAMVTIVSFMLEHFPLKQKCIQRVDVFWKDCITKSKVFAICLLLENLGSWYVYTTCSSCNFDSIEQWWYSLAIYWKQLSYCLTVEWKNDAISSRSVDEELFYCCHGLEKGTMAGCDSSECKIEWLHTK